MHQTTTLCALIGLLLTTTAAAQDAGVAAPKLKGSMKASVPKLDLGMPTFSGPKETNLQKVTETPTANAPSGSTDQPYTVLSVVNAKAFTRSGATIKSSPPLEVIKVRDMMTEKFASVIKVRGVGKRGSMINVKVVDPRGDTVMEADGQLVFHGDEVEWTVEWAPALIRNAGDCQMLISVAGQAPTAFPLKVEAKKE